MQLTLQRPLLKKPLLVSNQDEFAVKMADIYGIEKVWGYIYEGARHTETLPQKRVTQSARIF